MKVLKHLSLLVRKNEEDKIEFKIVWSLIFTEFHGIKIEKETFPGCVRLFIDLCMASSTQAASDFTQSLLWLSSTIH